MTTTELLRCINYIDDYLVMESSELINSKHIRNNSFGKKLLATAACITLVISICGASIFLVHNVKNYQLHDGITTQNLFSFSGQLYELITDEEYIQKLGLPEEISESIIGKLLQKDVVLLDSQVDAVLGDVYECTATNDNSIVIVKEADGTYCYATICLSDVNLSNINKNYDYLPPSCYFESNGQKYEIITDEKYIQKQKLPTEITNSIIGKSLATNVTLLDFQYKVVLGDVYECTKSNDDSIVVLKRTDGTCYYAVACTY